MSKYEHLEAVKDPLKSKRLASAGKPYPWLEVKVVDDENRELPVGKAGEVAVRAPHIMLGYWNKPEVTDETFQATVLENTLPVIVDFWAVWCPPCRILGPIIEEISNDYDGKAVVCKVDVDKNQSFAQKYNIRSIPTVLFFKNGEIKDQVIGALPKDQLVAKIDALLQES